MEQTFRISRARKAELKQRVIDLTGLCNDLACQLNQITDPHVDHTVEQDLKAGQTIRVRVPRRYMVRNA